MNPLYEGSVATAFTWLVGLALLTSVVACGKKAEIPPPAEPVAAVAGPSNEQAISAMLRGHPNSLRVCVDSSRHYAYFLDYGPPLKDGEPPDNKYHGWIFIENVDFFSISNNTWFVARMDERKYVEVYPDVTGLECRVQTR